MFPYVYVVAVALLHIGKIITARVDKSQTSSKFVLNYSYGFLGCIQDYDFIFGATSGPNLDQTLSSETFSSFKSIQFLMFYFNNGNLHFNRNYFHVK